MSEVIRFHQPTLFSGLTGTIDHKECVVHGVSLITSGITATGHDLFVDDASVNCFHDMGSKMGQLPVNLDHGSGIMSMNGYIDNFRKDQGKWRGDWHLLKTHDETPVMLERCERQPGTFGFSLAFSGDKKGVLRFGKKCAHPEALLSADCVVRPAANKSLFSVQDTTSQERFSAIQETLRVMARGENIPLSVDSRNNSERNIELQTDMPNTQDLQNQPSMSDLLNEIKGLRGELDSMKGVQDQLVSHINQDTENKGEPTQEEIFNELSRLNGLTDKELAAEGVDRTQLDQSIDQFNSSLQGNEGEQGEQSQEGEQAGNEAAVAAAPAGVESGAPGGATAFNALQKELLQLKAKFDRKEKIELQAKENAVAQDVEDKMLELAAQRDLILEFAQKAAARVDALETHLRTGTRPVATGVDEGIRLFSANGNGQLHPYQAKLKAIMLQEKCSEGKAINFADKDDNGALHADWLQSLSAGRTLHA